MSHMSSLPARLFAAFAFATSIGLLANPATVCGQQEVAEAVEVANATEVTEVVGDKTITNDDANAEKGKLQFSFEGEKWRDVIEWLADSSDLALHIGDLPTGSFTYTDSNSFTVEEAIDRVNLFLLPEGYTLVRSGKLLSVLNIGDPRGIQQLDTLAKLVTLDQLKETNDHDVVKCIFPVGDLEIEDAIEELSALNLVTPPKVFSKTKQLLLTDTASKLKTAHTILSAFKPDTLDNGTVVKNFALQHVDAEDILIVARPHLGLATGEMIGIDVSLSADLQGKNIFVTGVEDKVKMIEGLIEALDCEDTSLSTATGEAELKSHIVEGGNVRIVYDVLITLLAGKQVRLSMDETAGAVVALASPEIQKEIAATVAQLQASEAEFAVIQLKTIDPYFAVTLLEEMLDLGSSQQKTKAGIEAFTRHGNSRGLDIMDLDDGEPRIDADPANMRLFVRAKKPMLDEIRKIVEELDSGSTETNDRLRIFPLQGSSAEKMLETAAKFWREENPIFYYPPLEVSEPKATERVVADSVPDDQLVVSTSKSGLSGDLQSARLLTNNPLSKEPAIRCQLTPRGLLLQSDDTEALDKFEDLLRTVIGPVDAIPSAPIVFYLKYNKPDDAIRMLAELLDGGQAVKDSATGSLVNGYIDGSSGSYLSSIITTRDGTMTMIADTITIVSDSRLNRLIAQGTATDMEMIEKYLKIIDKDNSITSIETYGTSHVIELAHVRASEVAAAIREAYGGRVSGAGGGQPQQGGAPNDQAARDAARKRNGGDDDDNRGDRGKRDPRGQSGGSANSGEPTMTLAVHDTSNSLIVTAPEALFKEVEALAKQIDGRSERVVRIISVSPGMADELQQIFAGPDGQQRLTVDPRREKRPVSRKETQR